MFLIYNLYMCQQNIIDIEQSNMNELLIISKP